MDEDVSRLFGCLFILIVLALIFWGFAAWFIYELVEMVVKN